jgi:serine-type D-Ala-D-Ala carboxypeptidase/endopeptidase
MATRPSWTLPSDAAIKEILAERIDKQRDDVGIVVGVIDRNRRHVVAHGRYKRRGRREVDGRTLFEVGSITKVFTSLVLSDMALRGEVGVDDPVAMYLPSGVAMPERGGRKITLADLATHTSGLPRMPTNFAPQDWRSPYADYTLERLYAFLNGHVLVRDIGAQYEYSNIGVGLLGHVLARRLGTDHASLVKERIAGPLGLRDTSIQLSRDQRKRLAQGHDASRRPVPNLDDPEAFAGAGALLSTGEDLLTLLAVALGYEDAPLKGSIDAQLAYPMRKTAQEGFSQGLGWRDTENELGRVVWHGGSTWGYRSFIGLNPARGWGAIVLTNTSGRRGGEDLGMHILTGAPLAPAPKRRQTLHSAERLATQQAPRRAVPFDATRFDKYVGHYQGTAPFAVIAITRDGDNFYCQPAGLPAVQLYPESETKFFAAAVAAQIGFDSDARGNMTRLVQHHDGQEQPFERIDAATAHSLAAALAARIASNKPSPGTEDVLRRYASSAANCEPCFDELDPQLAEAKRAKWPSREASNRARGALKSITFAGVDPRGNDLYDVVYQNGRLEWRVSPLGPDGKVTLIGSDRELPLDIGPERPS